MKNKIGVFCASSDRMTAVFYEKAAELGKWLGESGRTLVYGGANCGLMEAVAQAVKKSGGKVFGVVPRKLVETNRVSDCIDITFHCEDLSDRKDWLMSESDIMVVLPGSVGTLDEMFCALSANSFGMNEKKVIIWNINGYYDLLIQFMNTLEGHGVVNKPFRDVMYVVESLEEIKNLCEK